MGGLMGSFGALNWAIVLAFLAANLLLGWWLSRRVVTSREFHVGSPSTPWWAVGLSAIAAYVSALGVVGAPAWSIPGLPAGRPAEIAPDAEGWQTLPGRIDKASRPLLLYFVATILLLLALEALVPAVR